MLAQTNDAFGQLAPAIGWFAGLVVLFGPTALGLMWIVDRVRDFMGEKGFDPSLKWLWPVLALVLSLVLCLVFQINIIAPAIKQVPLFLQSNALDGVWGQVVTAVGLAGLASAWHDRNAARARANRIAASTHSHDGTTHSHP